MDAATWKLNVEPEAALFEPSTESIERTADAVKVAAMPVVRPVGDGELAGRCSRGELILRVGDRGRLRGERGGRSDCEEGCEGEGPQQACLEKRCGSHAATVERGPNRALSAP